MRGEGTVQIVDGALAPTDTSVKRALWTAQEASWKDVWTSLEYTTGDSITTRTSASTFLSYVDEANYLRAESRRDFINIFKRENHLITLLKQIYHPATLPGQRCEWVFSRAGNQLLAKHRVLGNSAQMVTDYVLTPEEESVFTGGGVGWRILPNDLDYRYHRFEVQSLSG